MQSLAINDQVGLGLDRRHDSNDNAQMRDTMELSLCTEFFGTVFVAINSICTHSVLVESLSVTMGRGAGYSAGRNYPLP